MRLLTALIAALALSLVLTGCADEIADLQTPVTETVTETVTAEPEPADSPEPAPSPEPAEAETEAVPEPEPEDPTSAYVDGEFDPTLEALAEACVDEGDGDACWDLFMDSPVDSEYEALGLDRASMTDMDGLDPETNEAINEMALNVVWDGLSGSERDEICLIWTLDRELAIESFLSGAEGGPITEPEIETFFDSKCPV